MRIRAVQGRCVWVPARRGFLAEGEVLEIPEPIETYWFRRIQDGDAVQVAEDAPGDEPPASAESKSKKR